MEPGLTRPAIYGRVITGVCLVPILGIAPRGLIWSEATTQRDLTRTRAALPTQSHVNRHTG
jgi:hypothetical protein